MVMGLQSGRVEQVLKINPRSIVPKYRQLANEIIRLIKTEGILQDEMLPSLHNVSSELELSKGSAVKAYELLKARGILGSVKGKGYYLKNKEKVDGI